MKSDVYFIETSQTDEMSTVIAKFACLLDKSGLMDCIGKGDKSVIKIHFGEEGNTGYVRPEYLRGITERIINKKAACVLSDTNTLYRGRRTNSIEHKTLAYEHGFLPEVTGCQVEIPDDTKKENIVAVEIEEKFIKSAKIARIFVEADALLGIAHFKGHLMTGFAGALKNLGMGCATREGKLAQHSGVSPFVIKKKCLGCSDCVKICPVKSIQIHEGKAVIDSQGCIGCASCIAACSHNAIEINWEAGGSSIQEKMVEYAKAVLLNKKGKQVFINFATKITKECDCLAKDDPRIVSDIGIFASFDPVSIDKACFDLINQRSGKDIFKEVHPKRDGLRQLRYASELGLGNLEYELVKLPYG